MSQYYTLCPSALGSVDWNAEKRKMSIVKLSICMYSLHMWYIAGETRVGIFAQRNIAVDEELSYDYRFTHTGQTADAYR